MLYHKSRFEQIIAKLLTFISTKRLKYVRVIDF